MDDSGAAATTGDSSDSERNGVEKLDDEYDEEEENSDDSYFAFFRDNNNMQQNVNGFDNEDDAGESPSAIGNNMDNSGRNDDDEHNDGTMDSGLLLLLATAANANGTVGTGTAASSRNQHNLGNNAFAESTASINAFLEATNSQNANANAPTTAASQRNRKEDSNAIVAERMEGDQVSSKDSDSDSTSTSSTTTTSNDTRENGQSKDLELSYSLLLQNAAAVAAAYDSDDDDSDSDNNESEGDKMAAEASKDELGNELEKTRKRRLEREAIDLKAAIEHILMVGNSNRHRTWRREVWERLSASAERKKLDEKNNQEEESEDSDTGSQGNGKDDSDGVHLDQKQQSNENNDDNSMDHDNLQEDTSCRRMLHAEDTRIYGLADGFEADPWPRHSHKKKRFKMPDDIDAPWNREHGDSIHSLEFMSTVLSQAPVPCDPQKKSVVESSFDASKETEMLLDSNRINQMDPDRLKCTIHSKDVPRAFLLRCWQRAVDAATFSTLQQPQPEYSSSTFPTNDVGMPEFGDLKDATLRQQLEKPAEKRCHDLLIDPVIVEKTTSDGMTKTYECEQCGNDFESLELLRKHFYGDDHVRGCCWPLIHAKQRSLILTTLENEATGQADSLVYLVSTKLLERLEKRPKTKKKSDPSHASPRLFNWKDVVDMLREAHASARGTEISGGTTDSTTTCERETTKSIHVHDELAPLVLNEHVLEAAYHRLADRYADIAR